MRINHHTIFIVMILLWIQGFNASIKAAGSADFELPQVNLPAIPATSVSIVDYGAVSDGKTLNHTAIQKAIDDLAAKGGGRVIIPSGMWMTGPISLKSNIDLHLEQGALVVFSGDFNLYPDRNGLITGKDLENVVISGQGIFEGSGDAWRPVKKFKMTERQWNALLESSRVLTNNDSIWWPSQDHINIKRPRLVRLDDCKRVLIEDATFRNSPSFALDLSDCENLTIRNVNVLNFWYAQNGDGIDLHSCKNVQIIGARVDVGDDAICMKSNRGKPLENVLIKDCVVYHGHGGFVIGSEEVGGMNHIRVRDCLFLGTDVGIRFKSARDRGGLVTNIDIKNIDMVDIREQAILFDLYYQAGLPIDEHGMITRSADAQVPAVTETTPRFQNISIRDIICRGAEYAVIMAGLPEMFTQNILLENVSLTARYGMICMDARDIELRNVEIINREGPALHVYNTQRVMVDNFQIADGVEAAVRVQGKQNEGLKIENSDFSKAEQPIKHVEDK
ncbi:MAG: glycoside hydrolase family 28 protein [Sedimentisphaerales bacterium]|nr:glycoside hydrolase family 28 protein [Sedimentisphaerales bacterium]